MPNTTCTWSVEPAAMFQQSSGTGEVAELRYATPFVHLAPKATITFTFSYGCDNHYTTTKEIDLRIPTTTISGIAESDGFVIDDNAVVTVTGEIRSNPQAAAIVPQGSRLILNGGRMTSNSNAFWPGIEVWGNSTAHQYPDANGRYAQGYVELRNGAVIENAECAVSLWRPGHWNATGGIVRATGATFRNCTQSVQARHYTNHHPATGGEAPYNAHFRGCTFTIDQGYLGTETFYRHVDLSHVNGVRFEGCDFIVDRSVAGVSHYCSGIGAYTSGFSAVAFCDQQGPQFLDPCPEHLTRGCTFTGFHCGIHATNDGSAARSFIVSKAGFENNTMGIYALNTGFATILGCDFTVGCGSDCNYGIQRHQGTSS